MVSRPRKKIQRTSPPFAEIGQAIRFFRGLRTQAEVAALAKVHPSTWSLYEAGRRKPSSTSFDRICAGLGCTAVELEKAIWRFRRVRVLGQAPLNADRVDDKDPIRRELIELTAPLVDQLVELLLWLRRADL